MNEYILLMHGDSSRADGADDDTWGPYLTQLKASGCFDGGSSIGAGVCLNKQGKPVPVSSHLVGFLRVRANDLEHARSFVVGNPVFEAGGTVELRELPKT